MKGLLNSVIELSQKYVDLGEYKKFSCINIDKAVPEIKLSADEDEDGLSETKYEQFKINKRKRRRYTNSFLNKDNLIVIDDASSLPNF